MPKTTQDFEALLNGLSKTDLYAVREKLNQRIKDADGTDDPKAPLQFSGC